jgi:hypothetical protein
VLTALAIEYNTLLTCSALFDDGAESTVSGSSPGIIPADEPVLFGALISAVSLSVQFL